MIDFTGYTQGVSTLDVVVDDDRAYEAIIVVGQQPPEVINKQVTKVNDNQETRVQFVYPDPPDPQKCDEGEELINGKCEPQEPEECGEGYAFIDGRCQFCEYYDGNGECRPMPSVQEKPEPKLPVVNCYEGWHADASGTCQPDDPENPTMPSCDLNPNQPECETTSESAELAILLENEELPEDEGEESDEVSEEEAEEESGGSEDEVENEDSEEESGGESGE